MKLTNLFDWDEPDYDSLSYHHAAGAAEANVEEEVGNMMKYIGDPEMQEYIRKHYPSLAKLNVEKQAEEILFTKVDNYSVLDHLEAGLDFTEFENLVDDAMKVIGKRYER